MKNNSSGISVSGGDFSKYRILIVEDNPVDRELLKNQLDQFGFMYIQEAKQGGEGIFKLENATMAGKPFDLLITDWKMPETDGLSLVKYIRSKKELKKTKVVMLTSISDAAKVQQALHEGIDDFVLKPIDIEILKKKIKGILGRSTAA